MSDLQIIKSFERHGIHYVDFNYKGEETRISVWPRPRSLSLEYDIYGETGANYGQILGVYTPFYLHDPLSLLSRCPYDKTTVLSLLTYLFVNLFKKRWPI